MSSVKQQRNPLLLPLLLPLLQVLLPGVHGDRDCSLQDFKAGSFFDSNFEMQGLSDSYSSGLSLRVHCKLGFRGFFKLTCQDGTWKHVGDRCSAISCGHPGDVMFADFSLVRGDDFVFGSQVQYSCHRGYQMTSLTSTRNCMQGGWDGHLPVCEALQCPVLAVDPKVSVDGDVEQAVAGSVVRFSCRDRGDQLVGAAQIECDETGTWTHAPPICKEISCPVPPLENFQVNNQKAVYREKDVLRYSCDAGFRKLDGRPILCLKMGLAAQWTPAPQCELITCALPRPLPEGTVFLPQDKFKFKVRETVRVKCSDDRWVKDTHTQDTQLHCTQTGDWDHRPTCQLVTCDKVGDHVYIWGRTPKYQVDLNKPVTYKCHTDYEETSKEATCTRNGLTPQPLCTERGCSKPDFKNTDITDRPQYDKYRHNARLNLKCRYDERVRFPVTCHYGNWKGLTACKEKPCAAAPELSNGEMEEASQALYEHGAYVWFRCTGGQDRFKVTCQSGTWINSRTCEDVPCTSAPVIANAQMLSVGNPPFANGHKLNLRCTTGATDFTMSCQSGKWRPEHTCPEPSTCGDAQIHNGFSLERQKNLFYTCSSGFKLLSQAWWGVARCEGGRWTTQDCVEATDCGPAPSIPHLNVTYTRQSFSHGESVPLQCESGYTSQLPHQELTCNQGTWTPAGVDYEHICTPELRLCRVPPRRENALVLAPVKEQYSSGTVLTYQCRDGFTMEGNPDYRCYNGTWDQHDIFCVASRDVL
ncbi:unnamed protein product [Knipowitschia caucasica]